MEKRIKMIQNSFAAIVSELLNQLLIEFTGNHHTVEQLFFLIFELGLKSQGENIIKNWWSHDLVLIWCSQNSWRFSIFALNICFKHNLLHVYSHIICLKHEYLQIYLQQSAKYLRLASCIYIIILQLSTFMRKEYITLSIC